MWVKLGYTSMHLLQPRQMYMLYIVYIFDKVRVTEIEYTLAFP